MSATETPAIDKSGWGEGPWQHEPDRKEWIHAGFACLALRHPRHGFWCGYVGVPREHPLYEQDWSTTDRLPGRVNYAAKCRGNICHTPFPGMPDDVWWFGFDCGSGFEMAPAHKLDAPAAAAGKART